jgi:hypothetical protein
MSTRLAGCSRASRMAACSMEVVLPAPATASTMQCVPLRMHSMMARCSSEGKGSEALGQSSCSASQASGDRGRGRGGLRRSRGGAGAGAGAALGRGGEATAALPSRALPLSAPPPPPLLLPPAAALPRSALPLSAPPPLPPPPALAGAARCPSCNCRAPMRRLLAGVPRLSAADSSGRGGEPAHASGALTLMLRRRFQARILFLHL